MEPYINAFRNYAVFSGRTSRGDYWNFVAINLFFFLGIGLLGSILEFPLLANLYALAILIPCSSIGVRRMHDVNKSGWFFLIPIYGIILAVTEGTPGVNRFGPEPSLVTQLL